MGKALTQAESTGGEMVAGVTPIFLQVPSPAQHIVRYTKSSVRGPKDPDLLEMSIRLGSAPYLCL